MRDVGGEQLLQVLHHLELLVEGPEQLLIQQRELQLEQPGGDLLGGELLGDGRLGGDVGGGDPVARRADERADRRRRAGGCARRSGRRARSTRSGRAPALLPPCLREAPRRDLLADSRARRSSRGSRPDETISCSVSARAGDGEGRPGERRRGSCRPGTGPRTGRSACPLSSLHRDALGEVARLVHVASPLDGHVVGEQLQRDHREDGHERVEGLRDR